MRSTLAIPIALLALLECGAANAADPAQLAETGAYLLGNAHRCGVPAKRVKNAGKVIRDLIVVAARDAAEATAAQSRFVKIFVASAAPGDAREGAPSCKVVVAQFKRLEQYHQQAGLN